MSYRIELTQPDIDRANAWVAEYGETGDIAANCPFAQAIRRQEGEDLLVCVGAEQLSYSRPGMRTHCFTCSPRMTRAIEKWDDEFGIDPGIYEATPDRANPPASCDKAVQP